jgi:hypothetical protein
MLYAKDVDGSGQASTTQRKFKIIFFELVKKNGPIYKEL